MGGSPGQPQSAGSAVSAGLSQAACLVRSSSYVAHEAETQRFQGDFDLYKAALEKYWGKRDHSTVEGELVNYLLYQKVKKSVAMQVEFSRPDDADPNYEAMNAAIAQFTLERETEIISRLLANPIAGATAWAAFLQRLYAFVEHSKELTAFRNKVEKLLLAEYAKKAAAEATASSGMSAQMLQSLADVQVRAIVANHRQDFLQAASNGVQLWIMPDVPSSKWPEVLSGGSLVAGSIGSIVTVGATLGTVVATAGIGLLVAGVGLGIAGIYAGLEDDEEAERRRKLERAVKGETLSGFEKISEGIEAQEDVLALLCATEAIKAGHDLNTIARNELRDFVWQKMFADFPEDQTAGRRLVEQKMHQELDSRFE
jgi:hypothetical protein